MRPVLQGRDIVNFEPSAGDEEVKTIRQVADARAQIELTALNPRSHKLNDVSRTNCEHGLVYAASGRPWRSAGAKHAKLNYLRRVRLQQ